MPTFPVKVFKILLILDPTSYDYDAPMTECGDATDKYRLIRDTIKKHHPELIDESLLSQVKNSEKSSYGKVMFTQEIPFNKLKTLSVFGRMNERIETFEELGLDFGFLMLESDVEKEQVSTLTIADPRDRVYVFLDGNYQNFIYRCSLQCLSCQTTCLSLSCLTEIKIHCLYLY